MATDETVKEKEKPSRKRGEEEARHLMREARRILKAKQTRIPATVSGEIEDAIAAVEAALGKGDEIALDAAVTQLDAKMDQHLAFARKSALREYGESIGIAILIAILLRTFVIEAFQIPSGSMIPTLEIGDHIFVSKFSYGLGVPMKERNFWTFGTPKRGDVVVFRFPQNTEIDYIKRVVGLPGETVEVRKNEVFIDGRPMAREHVAGPCEYDDAPMPRPCDRWLETLDGKEHAVIHNAGGMPSDYKSAKIPPGHVFVMGDNRDNSNDSRFWGFVPVELVKGRALIVWWSRPPVEAGLSPSGIGAFFGSIRWSRFFSLVK